jgi:signal peptidase II
VDFQGVGELKAEEGGARPGSERAFLKRRVLVLPGLKAQLIFWPSIAVGIALDLWSKKAVFDWLQRQQRSNVSIIDGFLRVVMALNDGAAFGIFSGKPYLLAAVSIVALVAVFVVFLSSGAERKLVHVALGLFAAGVCGNLYDRIFNNGLVRDFIDVVYWPGRHWPAFNIADSMLCIAVGLLIISALWTPKRPLFRVSLLQRIAKLGPHLGSHFTEKSSRKHAQQRK